MNNLSRREFVLAAGAMAAAISRSANAAPEPEKWPWPFYVMDTGLVGPDVPTLEDKVKLAAELGFSGYDYMVNYQQLPRLIDLLDKAKLELTALYTSPLIEDPLDPNLPEAVKQLKGRPTRIEMALRSKKYKSSDPAGDEIALALLKRASDLCADSGPVVSIYPHTGAWSERVDDGTRLCGACGRKNVGANFNLVHWKWVKQNRPLQEVLREAMPHLFLVSINGLNDNAIVPLGEGNYDVEGFLSLLKKTGYAGRVGLQGYGIKGNSRDHLSESIKNWEGNSGR